MASTDRVKAALYALLGWGYPRVDYYTTYRAKVVAQSADLSKVDIKPDDPRIPPRSGVPVKWGIPGVTAQVASGCFVNHGWDNGNPSKPYVALIEGGATLQKLVIDGSVLHLAGETGSDKIATVKDLQFLLQCLTSAGVTVGPSPGGLLAAPLLTALATGGWVVDPGDGQLGSSKVKAVRIG